MRRASLAAVVLAAATGLAGCRGSKPAPAPPPPPRVTVVRPATVPVRDYWLYNGYLEQTKAAEVRSKVRGYLTKVEFVEGTEVAAGDPLYAIDKVEFNTAVRKADAEEKKAAAEIENWKAQIVQAEADLTRITTAVNSGAESKTELDKAKATRDVRVAERDAAKANREAAFEALHSAKIQLGYTDIKAKIGGRISRTMVDEGTLIQADTTLLTTILKVDELYVYFDAPEADLIAYQQSVIARGEGSWVHRMFAAVETDLVEYQQAVVARGEGSWIDRMVAELYSITRKIPVEVGVTKEDGYPHVGKIDFRENKVEAATGTIRIRGKIDNPLLANNVRLLFPGMYARVRVPKGDEAPQLALPEDCLLSGQEGRYVYVVAADGKVEKRVVTVGAVVWKAVAPVPGPPPPGWVAVNPSPAPAVEGQPPIPTRRPIKSVVAVTFHKRLEPDERVILDGLQQVRPGSPVTPEEWNLIPPADAKKK